MKLSSEEEDVVGEVLFTTSDPTNLWHDYHYKVTMNGGLEEFPDHGSTNRRRQDGKAHGSTWRPISSVHFEPGIYKAWVTVGKADQPDRRRRIPPCPTGNSKLPPPFQYEMALESIGGGWTVPKPLDQVQVIVGGRREMKYNLVDEALSCSNKDILTVDCSTGVKASCGPTWGDKEDCMFECDKLAACTHVSFTEDGTCQFFKSCDKTNTTSNHLFSELFQKTGHVGEISYFETRRRRSLVKPEGGFKGATPGADRRRTDLHGWLSNRVAYFKQFTFTGEELYKEMHLDPYSMGIENSEIIIKGKTVLTDVEHPFAVEVEINYECDCDSKYRYCGHVPHEKKPSHRRRHKCGLGVNEGGGSRRRWEGFFSCGTCPQ
jgi:hypothetical protein